MSESTLTLTYTSLFNRIARKLGYSPTTTDTNEVADISQCLVAGQQRFYLEREWSFLRPVTTLRAWASASGTIAASDEEIVDSDSGGVFDPTMVGQTIVDEDDNEYEIIAYTDANTVTVDSDASASNGKTFTITADGRYQLPDNFAVMDGDLTFTETSLYAYPVSVTGEGRLRALKQRAVSSTGRPQWAATRIKDMPASGGQRSELLLFPVPDQLYEVEYRFTVLPDAVAASPSNPYPLGGASHARTILLACEAECARMFDDSGESPDEIAYLRALNQSVRRDVRASAPGVLGYNGNPSRDESGRVIRRAQTVTYNGVSYTG